MSAKRKRIFRFNRLHLWTLISRYTRQTVGNFKSVALLLLQMPVMLLLISLIYEPDTFTNPARFFHATTVIFMFVIIACFMPLLNSYREITKERDILTREIAGGLDSVSYVTSKFFVLTAVVFVQSLILAAGSFMFVDFNFSNPFVGFLVLFFGLFLVGVCCTSVGLLISALIKKSENAVLPLLLVMMILIIFAGSLFDFAPPAEYLLYLSPSYWAMALFGNVLGFKHKPMFSHPASLSILVLIGFIVVYYLLTVFVVRRSTKNPKIM